MMPRPSLPVLSARSCSTQRPKEAIFGSATTVSLSRPALAHSPMIAPNLARGVRFHLRAGVCDGDEVLARILFHLADLIVPVAVEHERLRRRPGLRRNDEERVLHVNLFAELGERVGVGRIQNEEFGVALLLAEGSAEDFGAERRAAHAAEHDGTEAAFVSYAVGEGDEVVFDADHLVGHCEPAQGVLDNLLMRLVRLPERRVLAPDAAHHVALLGLLYRG